MHDVGKPKAVVAAERINARVPGANVTAHFGRIEDMPLEFYQEFTVIILGLDSLEARRYMNSIACSLLGEQISHNMWQKHSSRT
jgi:ubiquitin-activating enzyme E1 C